MTKTRYFMMDIETWGLTPGSAIRSVAMIDFTDGVPTLPGVKKKGRPELTPMNSIHFAVRDGYGTVDQDTREWWAELETLRDTSSTLVVDEFGLNDPYGFKALPQFDTSAIPDLLTAFVAQAHSHPAGAFVPSLADQRFYANDPDFDKVLLEAPKELRRDQEGELLNGNLPINASNVGLNVRGNYPWHYNQWLAVRTVKHIGKLTEVEPSTSRNSPKFVEHNALHDCVVQAEYVQGVIQSVLD